MDNIQFWLYVIVGVIYLISRARKKAQEKNMPKDFPESSARPTERPFEQTTSAPKPKQLTFEELLREITEAKEVTRAPAPEYVDYDDDIEDEEKSLEMVPAMDDDKSTKIYEDAKKMAFNRPSLEETLKLSDVNTDFGRFAEFDKKATNTILTEYTKELRDPKGFKKAIILSEILNRKHF
jgi:hypothetical protein